MTEIAAELFDEAFGYHRQGEFARAIPLYKKMIDADSEHADAWHLMGLALYQGGRSEDAVQRIQRAVELEPSRALFQTNLATVLNSLKRYEDASIIAHRASELDSTDGDAFHQLGVAFIELGDANSAEKALQTAVGIQPRNAEYLNNLGVALNRLGLTEEAERCFRRTLEADPDSPTAAVNWVEALVALDRTEDALAFLRNQVARSPNDAKMFLSEGKIFMSNGQFKGAIQAFEKCLALKSDDRRAKMALANALSFSGDTARAETLMVNILHGEPDNPEMLHALGLIHGRRGSFEEATKLCEKAIQLDPGRAQAYLDLIGVTGLPLNDDQLGRLLALVDSGEISKSDYISSRHALSNHFDLCGDYERAGQNLRAANNARRTLLVEAGNKFDASEHLRRIEKIIQTFTSELLANPPGVGSRSELPVFVVGLPRSGTTLIERIIASHTSGAGAGELTYINGAAKGDPQSLIDISRDRLEAIAVPYLEQLSECDDTALRVVDKFPANFLHLGFIRILFPNARIIHCRRDVRDVGLSCYFQNFTNSMTWSRDLRDIGKYIVAYQRLMAHWREILHDRYHEIEYEALVGNSEFYIRELIAFLGLEWDPACMSFYLTEGEVHTASARQVRQPIYDRSVGRWKNYQNLLAPMIEALS